MLQPWRGCAGVGFGNPWPQANGLRKGLTAPRLPPSTGPLRKGPGHQQVRDTHALGLACAQPAFRTDHTSENTCLRVSRSLLWVDSPSLPKMSERQGSDHRRERRASFRRAPAHTARSSESGGWARSPVLPLWAAAVEMQERGLGSHDCRIRATNPSRPMRGAGREMERKTAFTPWPAGCKWSRTFGEMWGYLRTVTEGLQVNPRRNCRAPGWGSC